MPVKKFLLNLCLVLMLSVPLAGCVVLQEWFENILSIQEEQEQ